MLNIVGEIDKTIEYLIEAKEYLTIVNEITYSELKEFDEREFWLSSMSDGIKNRIGKIKETLSSIETFERELYLQKSEQLKDKGMKL